MNWSFTNDKPIYLQIMDQIKIGILSGEFPLGSPLPSVRDMAAGAEVNPNTMQKALSELENEGLLHSQRTTGRFVTEDEKMIIELKETLSKKHITNFLTSMRELGLSDEETLTLLQKGIKEVYGDEHNTAVQ